MKTRYLLPALAALSLVLPMCDDFDGPVAAGTVVAVDPAADALLLKAQKAYQQGKFHRARGYISDILDDHPMAPCAAQARLLRAETYYAQKDYREAFKQYSKVVHNYQDSPLYQEAHNRRLAMATQAAGGELKTPVMGGLWYADMESSEVEKWLREIIADAPYHEMAATASSVLGQYLFKQDMPEKACAVFSQLVERYPDSKYAPEAQLMVAQIWANSRTRGNNNLVNLHKAQEAYEEFSLRFPNHPDAKKALSGASEMKRLLVQQQLEVGRYYLERSHQYEAAVFCLENVQNQKEANPQAAEEAERLLVRARKLAGKKP